MSLFQGAGVALVTPFAEDLSVNYQALEKMIARQIEGGTDALIVCGTTGEPPTMTEEERLSVIRFAVEKVNHRIPVIAGSGGNNTAAVVEFSKEAEALGVDGLLIVTPYYNKATQKGLYEHYRSVASAVRIPIIMYNVPSRSGCNIQPQTAVQLALDCDNIIGIKEASGNLSQVAKLASLLRSKQKEAAESADGSRTAILDIYSGNDDQILPVLSLGGIGVISVLSNVAPEDTHRMVVEYLQGNHDRALELQLKYMDLIDALFCEVNPIPVKAALNLMGLEAGGLRLPLTEMEEENKKRLFSELRKCGCV